MGSLEDLIVKVVNESLSLEGFLAALISRKLSKSGLVLDSGKLLELKAQLKRQLDARQLSDLGSSLSLHFQLDDGNSEIRESKLKLTSDDLQEFREVFPKAIEQAADELVLKASELILEAWKEQAPSILPEQQAEAARFEREVGKVWGKALDLLDVLLSTSQDTGGRFYTEHRLAAKARNDCTFDALTRLHARGCQVGREILVLLRSGLADGAHARWRTLHELAVTASFIRKHGNDVAERYLCHAVIDTYKAVHQHQQHCQALGWEPIPEEEFNEIKGQYDFLLKRFGQSFKGDYGWAESVLPRKADFYHIEQNAGLEHLRPFFKMASGNVHATSNGTLHRLGLPPFNQDILVTGLSIFGLGEPGRNAAYSINQLNANLLLCRTDLDYIASIRATQKLMHEVHEAFYEAEAELESKNQ
jgi:hypothetical protein